jgi:uncharacterized protein (TIGR02145 family)
MKKFMIISIVMVSIMIGPQITSAQPGTSSRDTLQKPDSLSCGLLNYEGQIYHTVKIGGQCWMIENLNVGKWIDQSQQQKQSDNGIIEKYCFGNNFVQCDYWGGLYQWEEMMGYSQTAGVQGICPPGWHVPSSQDWKSVIRYLGGDNQAGGKLKSTLQWQMPNVGASNSSGFSAYPGGYFDFTAQNWHDLYRQGYYWTSEIISKETAVAVNLSYRTGTVDMYEENQPSALSVRCIKY